MDTAVDVSRVSRAPQPRAAPLWWGTVGLILIAAMLIASLMAAYFYLRLYAVGDWPPPVAAASALARATLDTVLLLGSGMSLRWSERRLRGGGSARWQAGLGAALALSATVVLLRAQAFADLTFRWDSHAYGSIVWVTLGLHTLLVVLAWLWLGALAVVAARGVDLRRHFYWFAAAALFWYFVALVWLPLYLLLYWAPRWM